MKLDHIRERMCQARNARETVQILVSLSEKESTEATCLLWYWWNQRNKINAKENVGSWEQVVRQTNSCTAESLQRWSKKKAQEEGQVGKVWQAPTEDRIKLNIDGAFHANNRTGGWGFVARDHAGDVCISGAGYLPFAASAAQTEAYACAEAIQAAVNWGMTNIHIEADALNLIRAIQSKDFDLTPEGILYRDIRLQLQLNFSCVLFSFTPRECNNVAHCLAAYGVSRKCSRSIWSDTLPDDVKVMVASASAEPS
jgi:hypothetical protein